MLSTEATPARKAFIEKYIPLLEEIANDPEKQRWCENYSAFEPTKGDCWNLELRIYCGLMHEAYSCAFVPKDYLETARIVEEKTGRWAGEILSSSKLAQLTDKELVGIVGVLIRSDYWSEGSLVSNSIAEGKLLLYLKELQRRWF